MPAENPRQAKGLKYAQDNQKTEHLVAALAECIESRCQKQNLIGGAAATLHWTKGSGSGYCKRDFALLHCRTL